MANKSFIITILALISYMQLGYSQDPEFSQFYANPLYLNPALAGATVCPRAMANFRDQWPSLGGAYVTYNAGFDEYVDVLHGGLGILLTADRTGGGKLNTTEISLIYAYKFNITEIPLIAIKLFWLNCLKMNIACTEMSCNQFAGFYNHCICCT